MQLHTKPSGCAKADRGLCGGLENSFMKAATSFLPGLLRQPHAIHIPAAACVSLARGLRWWLLIWVSQLR